MWERFFNWQSDMDWTWGPFLALRPRRTEPMQPWVWARLFAALSGAGALLLILAAVICVRGPRLAARAHWSLPPAVTETLGTVAAMGADPNARGLLIGLALFLPPLFFGFCLPFHLAWNRRAARLAAEETLSPAADAADIWPPAPRSARHGKD